MHNSELGNLLQRIEKKKINTVRSDTAHRSTVTQET